MPSDAKKPENAKKAWILFSVLSLIWGSSFVLMKIGMFAGDGTMILTAWQVAAIRIFTSGLILLPFGLQAWRRIHPSLRAVIFLSGWLGSFLPAFLFCVAESKIDSALAGTLNATTPLFTILIAIIFYKQPISTYRILGILLGLAGCVGLFLVKTSHESEHFGYALLVLAATICYGWNVNLVKVKMSGVSALDIASLAFVGLMPFSLAILYATGYFSLPLLSVPYLKASGAATLLGTLGTAIASIIFYRLVKLAGIVFASLVTYAIPFVAIGWGLVYGENIVPKQLVAMVFILAGVYLSNYAGKHLAKAGN